MESFPVTKPSRLLSLDMAKGIGIIFVVWAHAKGPFSSYIYQFHMPFFFLISGYLFNPNTTFRQFAKRKAISLYLPFIFWNSAAILIKALLHLLSWPHALRLELQILLTLNKDGQFFGATWFLGSLFVVSLAYKWLDISIPECKCKRILITICFACLAITGFEITFPFMLSRTLILGMFYAAGYAVREYQELFKAFDSPRAAAASLLLFLLIGSFNSANMGKNAYRYPFSFVFGALLASYGIIFISGKLEKASAPAARFIQRIFVCLGRESIDIVIWQFAAFRLVIALQLHLRRIPLKQILEYYPVYNAEGLWWAAYLAAGILAPLLLGRMLKSITSSSAPDPKILR